LVVQVTKYLRYPDGISWAPCSNL